MSTTNPQPPHGDRHGDPHGQATAQAHPGQGRPPDFEALGATNGSHAASVRMSYKFQRLREKLRQAVASGELSGKLPGERALAKRFHVNAKTLSKALTDLAAEGLLDRSIGRGTYVKGSAPATSADGRWLVVCDADKAGNAGPCMLEHLRQVNPQV